MLDANVLLPDKRGEICSRVSNAFFDPSGEVMMVLPCQHVSRLKGERKALVYEVMACIAVLLFGTVALK